MKRRASRGKKRTSKGRKHHIRRSKGLKRARKFDVSASFNGSFWVLVPLTPSGHTWFAENLEGAMKIGPGVVVEDRYVRDIIEGMKNDGLKLNPTS
jgi:hypothetical protein